LLAGNLVSLAVLLARCTGFATTIAHPAPGLAEKKKEKRRTYLPTFFEGFLRFSGRI
jgi:hypothetical protein